VIEDRGNEFAVGISNAHKIVIQLRLPPDLTETQAINLAAWLVAVCGVSGEDFNALLEKVWNS